jgi:hypothetical protein
MKFLYAARPAIHRPTKAKAQRNPRRRQRMAALGLGNFREKAIFGARKTVAGLSDSNRFSLSLSRASCGKKDYAKKSFPKR